MARRSLRGPESVPRVTIRDYVRADRAHLVRCIDAMQDQMVALDRWRRTIRAPNHARLFIAKYLQEIRRKSGFILVAEVDNEPVGVAVAWQPEISTEERTTILPTRSGYLSDLAVLPGWRGRGIGTKLLRETERRFLVGECDQMTLGVFAPNRAAARLYRRQGFAVRGMWMVKRLGPPKGRWPRAKSSAVPRLARRSTG